MHELILASQSPRRRQLLEQAGYLFRTSSIEVSEIPKENLSLEAQIEDLAQRKALTFVQSDKAPKSPDFFVISADTVVVLDGVILGKPVDQNENFIFLERMSGKSHDVITGVCLYNASLQAFHPFHQVSKIHFRKLTESEMRTYVESQDGLDKAGGYGIQGEAGKFVDHVDGPVDNVIGLPIEKLGYVIDELGWKLPRQEN